MAQRTESGYSGQQLGNYRIDKKLARGSFGEVYLAEHVLLPRMAAIKFLHAALCISDQQRQEFLQEAKFLEALKHPHILPLYDVGIDQEGFPPYLIAAYAPGGSLRDRMRQQASQFALEEVLTILEQVGQALQHAHQQPQPVIHRDLKPENILFDSEGKALLADFGIAVVLDTNETQQVSIAGTLPYMAPEQFRGHASSKSDQYALGCLAYELVTGRTPIKAEGWFGWAIQHQKELPLPPSQFRPQVPLYIELAILKALAKDRDDRHADIESFVHAVRTAPHHPTQYQALKETWLLTAQAQYAQQRHEQALALYEYAARIDPTDIRPLKGKCEVFLALNRTPETLMTYEQILCLAPGDAVALAGIQHLRLQEPQRQHPVPPPPTLQPTRSLAQEAALVCKEKGDVCFRHKQYAEALVAYTQALQANPHVALDWCVFGDTCWHLTRYEEALVAYERTLQLQPDFVLAHCGKGDVLYQKRAYRQALAAYEQALQYDLACASAWYGKADSLLKLKRVKEARDAYALALRYDAQENPASIRQADALFLLERYPEALVAYERLLQFDPAQPDLHERRGNALKKLGKAQEAEEAYRRTDKLRGYV